MSLKCVSKQWLSFITTPCFPNLLPAVRASGLFIHHNSFLNNPGKLFFVPLDNFKTPSPFRALTFGQHSFSFQHICILHSCNGLLLCSMSVYDRNCYVCDPSTNYLAILPRHPPRTRVRYIGLVFGPLKSLHYKVIAFVYAYGSKNFGDFHIYSSETRTWRFSVKSYIIAPELNFSESVYWNSMIEEILETFPRPPIGMRSTSRSS